MAGNNLTITSQTTPPTLKVSENQTVNIVTIPRQEQCRLWGCSGRARPIRRHESRQCKCHFNANRQCVTIAPDPSTPLNTPANANVMVVYNKTTGVIQGLTLGRLRSYRARTTGPAMARDSDRCRPGMGPFSKPNGMGNPPGQNFMRPNGQGINPERIFKTANLTEQAIIVQSRDLKRQAT